MTQQPDNLFSDLTQYERKQARLESANRSDRNNEYSYAYGTVNTLANSYGTPIWTLRHDGLKIWNGFDQFVIKNAGIYRVSITVGCPVGTTGHERFGFILLNGNRWIPVRTQASPNWVQYATGQWSANFLVGDAVGGQFAAYSSDASMTCQVMVELMHRA